MAPRIPPVQKSQIPTAAAPILRQVESALGKVPNMHLTLAHAPAALKGYASMTAALGSGVLAPALREQIAIAIAAQNRCGYCASAHTALGRGLDVPAEELARNLGGQSTDGKTATALAFARSLLESRGNVEDCELATVREAGFSEAEIIEIVAHVGLNAFTNMFNVMARTEIDFPVVELQRVP